MNNKIKCELPGFQTATKDEQYKELQKTFKRLFKSSKTSFILIRQQAKPKRLCANMQSFL